MDSIVLQTGNTTVTDGDVIGRVGFAASSETGTNARLVVAKIEAVAEETFDASNNATEMVFSLAADGAAASKMTLTSAGNLNIGGELQTTNIGYTDGDNSMTIADGGKVTFAAGFAVGSDAAGDILYHNGTSYVRLGIGTDGQVLTVNDAANAPQWEAATGGTDTMGDGFVLEDGDGTEVTITENKEVKFIEGAGIDIDWTDTSDGSDADPYDLTFTVTGLTTTEIAAATLVTEADDIADNDNDTTIPTSAAVKDYADHAESILKCKNASGDTLNAGECVYLSGHSGSQIEVDLADNSDPAKMPSIGIVKTSASANAAVDIVTHGKLLGLDTSTPGWSVGDELYVNSTGGLTDTFPTGESGLIQKIAKVVRVHGSSGQIYIMGAGRTNATPNLNSAKIFLGNSSNKAVAAAITGDISISNTGAVTISNDAVNADKLADTTVSAGSYTAADITVDAQGRITAAANGTIALGSEVSGTLPVANGGTGASSLADKAVLITQDSGTDTVSAAVMDANGELLIGGTDGPAVATLTQGSNITITNGNGTIEIASTQLTTEQVQDIAGGMVTGNTETGISVTYQDGDGTLDFAVSDTTVAGDSGSTGITPGDTLTIAGGTNATTAMSGDTLTVNVDDAFLKNNADDTTSGTVTMANLIVGDGGDVGSASATDAISIASTGKITYGYGSVPKTLAGGTSGDVDLNANLSNYFTIAAAGTLNILIQNAEAGQRILLRIVTGGHGANITWDGTMTLTWPGGTAPTFTTNGTDVIGLLCTAANTFDGFIIGQNIS